MPEMPDCRHVLEQLWDYLDGELTPERRDQIAAHLEVCTRCYPRAEFYRTFLAALSGAGATPGATSLLRERVLALLRSEDAAGQ